MESHLNVLLINPLGSAGDIFPFVGLGRALRARGHSVTLMSSGFFRSRATQAGLQFVQLGPAEKLMADVVFGNPSGVSVHPMTINEALSVILYEVYWRVAEHYDPGQTIIIATLGTLGAGMAHDKLGVPVGYVAVSPSYLNNLTFFSWAG